MMTMTVKMSEKQSCQSQIHVTAFRCLRVRPQKVGLNRRLKAHTVGGGGLVLIQHLIK
jgi:hypothetical protein